MSESILNYDTVALDEEKDALVIIDQTKLPQVTELLALTDLKDIWDAIFLLKVRGAPAIGVAAAIGIYVHMKHSHTATPEEFFRELQRASDYLNSSRPTAVNLSWALKRMEAVLSAHREASVPELLSLLRDEALLIK
ncbi:MAG: S-methyl-5-thioribose-1-phosphate isomerase, partial [Lachnospiraceae bacterium]|nr:S-methyl-5-thioribose-1-phosphate isomerase [Lachnospiraceae bacterium]